jgi:hypothetical protein
VTAAPAGFDANQLDLGVAHEGVKHAGGVAAAADAGDDRVGQSAHLLQALQARFPPHHGLKVAHHHREGVRPDHAADDVVGVFHGRHPVAHRLVDGVAQRAAAAGHGDDLGAQCFHFEDVKPLPAHVFLAHVDLALEVEQRGGRGAGHAVLAGPSLGDHPRLAHAPRQQGLADGVVDLVRAGVVEVFALEEDPCAARLARQPFGEVKRRRPADVLAEVILQLLLEVAIVPRLLILLGQLPQRVHQGFRHKPTAVRTETALEIGDGRSRGRHKCSSDDGAQGPGARTGAPWGAERPQQLR